MALGVEQGTLECNRSQLRQITCQHTLSNLFGERITAIPNGQLQGAEVETSKRNHRLVILTQNQRIPLIESYTMGKSGKADRASQINTFIRNSEQASLTIEQDNRWLGYLFGAMFIFGGICALWGLA